MLITKPIFLIGFMGSGKSYQAKKIAAAFSIPAVDLDKLIEEKEQQTIAHLFDTKGEDYFRQAESEVLKSIDISKPAVIACGGGTPCFFNNMQWMNQHGFTIYLNPSQEIIFERLKHHKTKRPLLAELSDLELKFFIKNKIAEREVFYKQCQFEICDIGIDINSLYQKLIHAGT